MDLMYLYNATLELMEAPIIKFPNQTEIDHRLVVFLKCFMVAAMENKDIDMILVQRLQNYLVAGYWALTFVMICLSAELVWKAFPIMMFCYASQLLKFYALGSDTRTSLSYIVFVYCCLEIGGFEFVYDTYIILCFMFKSLYSLSAIKDHEQKERSELERLSTLLVFITEVGAILNSRYIDYRFILGVNAVLTIWECATIMKTMHVTILYVLMSKMLVVGYVAGVDMDASFDAFLKRIRNFAVEFCLQFLHGV